MAAEAIKAAATAWAANDGEGSISSTTSGRNRSSRRKNKRNIRSSSHSKTNSSNAHNGTDANAQHMTAR